MKGMVVIPKPSTKYLEFVCHSERSPYCECNMDVVKNPVNRGRDLGATFYNGILHCVWYRIRDTRLRSE